MNRAYAEKLINLKESEAVKDFEIGKLKKELQFLEQEYDDYKSVKEHNFGIVNKELDRLRKFMNDR